MGRIARQGLDYFSIDCLFEDNMNIVIARHKNAGLGIVVRLWQKCYKLRGYYMEWGEDNLFLFADEINETPETLQMVVETCFRVNVFDREIWEKHHILTSSGIQKRWLSYVLNAKRKDAKIDPRYFVSEKNDISPGEKPINSGDIPEKKAKTPVRMPRKERKGKEKKGSNSGAKNAPGQVVELEDGKIWTTIVETWFVTYETEFKEKPSFAGRDPATLKQLVKLVKAKVISVPGYPWTAETCKMHFDRFLQIALTDKWLKNNFLLQNLVSQFDKIITNGRSQTNQQPPSGVSGSVTASPSGKPGTSAARVEALKTWGSNFLRGDAGGQDLQTSAG